MNEELTDARMNLNRHLRLAPRTTVSVSASIRFHAERGHSGVGDRRGVLGGGSAGARHR